MAMEEERIKHYSLMGKSVIELADKEREAVDDITDSIIEKKRLFMELKRERRCPTCMLPTSIDGRYCAHCGQKLPPLSESEQEVDHEN